MSKEEGNPVDENLTKCGNEKLRKRHRKRMKKKLKIIVNRNKMRRKKIRKREIQRNED